MQNEATGRRVMWKARCFALLAASVGFMGCASAPIRHIRWNEAKYGYEINTNKDTTKSLARDQWSILRRPGQKAKVLDSLEAAQWVTHYNSEERPLKPSDICVVQQPFSFRQYRAGQEYFHATRDIKDKQYADAAIHIATAKKAYPGLEFFSDIEYLDAVCRHNLGDSIAADSAFTVFRSRSESPYPRSFFVRSRPSLVSVGQLVNLGYRHDGLPAEHVTNVTKGPALLHTGDYGFLPVVHGLPQLQLGLIYGYDDDIEKPNLFAFVGASTSDINPYIFGDRDQLGGGIKYQVHRRWDNRLGVISDVRYTNTAVDLSSGDRHRYSQYSIGLEAGYFVLPRMLAFAGGRYQYWNESHKYSGPGFLAWYDNNAYAGTCYYVWEYVGLIGKVNIAHGAQVGVSLMGMELLYELK